MDTINRVAVERTSPNYWIEQAEALERLENNKDFKILILEGYFRDKAITGTSILASDQIKQSGARTDVMEALIAVSSLQDHFNTIKAMGTVIDEEEDEDVEGEV